MGFFSFLPPPMLRRGVPAPEEELPTPRPIHTMPNFPIVPPTQGWSTNWPGSDVIPYDITEEAMALAQRTPATHPVPSTVGTGPGMTFGTAQAPQLRAATPAPVGFRGAGSSAGWTPAPGAPESSFGGHMRALPGAVLETLKGYGGGIARALGAFPTQGIFSASMQGSPEPAPGILPVARADTRPANPNEAAHKQARREPTAAAQPTVPFQPPAEGEKRVAPSPEQDPRNVGKRPGERGYVYTNLDLDRVRREGPSRGGFGTFTTNDPEERLFGQAMRIAEARGKALEEDPMGIKAYRARKEVEEEFGSRVDRQVLEQKNQIEAHAEAQIERARRDPNLSPEQRDDTVARIKEWRDQRISAIDPRYKPVL
jgi:hypothetical protein